MRPLRLKVGGATEREVATTVNQLIKLMGMSGTTAERPSDAPVGWPFFDTTLGKPIWRSGAGWVLADGTAA